MKIKHKKLWFFSGIAALVVSAAFQQTFAHHQARETELVLANVRLHERLFVEILRSEIGRALPGLTYTVTPSGGAMESAKGFAFTAISDITFRDAVPTDQLRDIAMTISSHNEITNWQSLAAQQQTSRFCQFHVVSKTEKPYLRMVMHESNQPNGLAEADLLKVFNVEDEPLPATAGHP
ncbi:MAG: hypothetical protein EOP87_15355 [Verrucomicrobiaceae bacterium]|nr:MAG: hypothetical protein EOP87_15355 [Verrucomicrobiaceae bacterium]